MGCVYQVRNKVNGKRYIGKTAGTMEKRRKDHKSEARNGSSRYFHRALRKYGFDSFEWVVLFVGDSEDELYWAEQEMIVRFSTKVPCGYNLTDGGEGQKGWCPPKEWRRKQSESKKGKKLGPQSFEHRRKLSGPCLRKRVVANQRERDNLGRFCKRK